jgi:hypothetical protein
MNVIRSWLGHVRIETTNRYAEATIKAKEAALKACEPPVSRSDRWARRPVWRDDPSLLRWLAAL